MLTTALLLEEQRTGAQLAASGVLLKKALRAGLRRVIKADANVQSFDIYPIVSDLAELEIS